MHLRRLLRIVGWSLFALGLAGIWLGAQDRVSDVLRGAPPAEASPAAGEKSPAVDDPAPADPVEGVEAATPSQPTGEPVAVVVVPITETIDGPNVYILRRAIKTAIETGADAVVLRIDTPGGLGSAMLEMMEAIQRFDGVTIAYVDDEAMSAGAFISFSADEIWYVPGAVIGSAAVVAGSGQEIPETMRQKIDSYIRAKIRAVENDHRYKADVMRAMMDAEFVLKVDGKTLKDEGELLALTAEEAVTTYGNPPATLFGEGIADDLDALLDARFGAGNWSVTQLEVTWSERLAKYLSQVAPVLVALGILAIFIEIKTPGFGFFGIAGIVLLGLVFASNYVAGLAGWEAFLVMLLGFALILIDIFFLPGTMVLMMVGAVLVLGSLLWSLSDVWPTVDGGVRVDPQSILDAVYDLALSVLLGMVGLVVAWRFLPRTGMFNRLVLAGAPGGELQPAGGSAATGSLPAPGTRGVVTRPLHPGGEVEIEGRRYEARVGTGALSRGDPVVVVRHLQFGLEVRKDDAS